MSDEEQVPARRIPRWLFWVGGLIIFNVLSYVFNWGWVLY